MDEAVEMLEDVWKYVKPGFMGLHKAKNFAKGVHKLCKHYGLSWKCRYIKVNKNAKTEKVREFIESGITRDCPVAFLNLHEGTVKAFDGWHWFVIVGIRNEDGVYMTDGFDGGVKIEFDLAEWVKSTKRGGGFAYII